MGAGWAIVYADPQERQIAQEDGSTKAVTINEATQLKSLMDNMKTPPGGVWLADKKFNINRMADDEECGEGTCKWAFGMSGAGADTLRAALLRPESGRYVQQSISSQTSREKRLFVSEPTAAWIPDENGKLTYSFELNEIDDPCVDGSQAPNKTQSINGMGHVVLDYRQVFRRHAKTVIRHV